MTSLAKLTRTTSSRDKGSFGKNASVDPFNKTTQFGNAAGGGLQASQGPSQFFVMCTGQVEFGEFGGLDNLYCRYALSFGNDWYIIHGPDTGLSQIAQRAGGQDTTVVWNFPIDVSFKATNAFGWPRLALSVFRVDGMNRDTIVGYGSVLIPTQTGRYEKAVHVYAPQPSSVIQRFRSWITGAYPEFFDSKFVTRGEGREATRVKRSGVIKVSLDIMTRGMASFGYNNPEVVNGSTTEQQVNPAYGTPPSHKSPRRIDGSAFG